MEFLVTLLVCVLLSWVAAPAIHKYPWVLYAIVIAVDILFAVGAFSVIPGPAARMGVLLMRRGTLAMALFTIVMFIGVLPHDSAIRARFQSVRAELSIAACLLVAMHIAVHIGIFLPRILHPGTRPTLAASIVISLVLFALVLVLGVTSFSFVKKRMDSHAWKNLQKWSYLFYGLVYFHIVLLLASGALAGNGSARFNLVVYTVVFVVYAIARLVRQRKDVQSTS
ncbi:MAG: hypothetical protein IJ113_03190 [Eggerthellaceae bacterium]|nr:hypothetical protein [Eggerthellaceae bacterium]